MAKRKAATPETPSTPAPGDDTAALPLTKQERQRAERVLSSQGRAIGMLDCFPPAMQRQLAELCDPQSGALKEGTREGVAELVANFYAEQKTDVDEQSFEGFGLAAPTPQPEAGPSNQ